MAASFLKQPKPLLSFENQRLHYNHRYILSYSISHRDSSLPLRDISTADLKLCYGLKIEAACSVQARGRAGETRERVHRCRSQELAYELGSIAIAEDGAREARRVEAATGS